MRVLVAPSCIAFISFLVRRFLYTDEYKIDLFLPSLPQPANRYPPSKVSNMAHKKAQSPQEARNSCLFSFLIGSPFREYQGKQSRASSL